MLFKSELRLGVDSGCGRGERESLFRLHIFTDPSTSFVRMLFPAPLASATIDRPVSFQMLAPLFVSLSSWLLLPLAQLAGFVPAVSNSYLLFKPVSYLANNPRIRRVLQSPSQDHAPVHRSSMRQGTLQLNGHKRNTFCDPRVSRFYCSHSSRLERRRYGTRSRSLDIRAVSLYIWLGIVPRVVLK